MLNLKVGLLGVVLLGATIAVACSSTSDSRGGEKTTAVQAQEKPEYPPLYHVEVQVCGDIVAPIKNGERCLTNQLRLWGPVGEAKLIRTGISLPSLQSVEHKIAIGVAFFRDDFDVSKKIYPDISMVSGCAILNIIPQ